MTDLPLTGGCQCGSVRYRVDVQPLDIYVCHCSQCRRQSASAFGISVVVPQSAFAIEQGTPATWSRPTATGHVLDCAFCTTCGSRLWHQRRGTTATRNVKGGSLDAPVDLRGATHIWTDDRLPGIVIPEDAPSFPGEPPG